MKLRALATIGLLSLATSMTALPALAQPGPGPGPGGPGGPGGPPIPPPPTPQPPPPPMPPPPPPMIGANGVPGYTSWQDEWNSDRYDKKHVIVGVVTDFRPYRIQLARDGRSQTIDLTQNTEILPGGMTPAANQRVAIVGYYSNGTFIATRVILRQ